MSKGSLFWANASGKLGEVVQYRAGGEQRARAYVRKIKNPKTLAQAQNRLSMLNLATAFKMMSEFIRVSFVNRPTNQSGFNAFVKANKNPSSPVISKNEAQQGLFVPTNMVVSDGGIILPFDIKVMSPSDLNATCIGHIFGLGESEEMLATDAFKAIVGSEFNPDDEEGTKVTLDTKEKISAALTLLGLPQDAVITLLRCEYMDEGWNVRRVKKSVNDVAEDELCPFFLYYNRISGTFIGFESGYDALTDDSIYLAMPISYNVNGKRDITRSSFIPSDSSISLAEDWMPGGFVYDQIMQSYVQTEASAIEV